MNKKLRHIFPALGAFLLIMACAGIAAAQATQDDLKTGGGTDVDLSGEYAGTVNYPDGNMSGPATLKITGNTFTLSVDGGSSVSGRISAVNTRGYIGATLRFGDATPANTEAPPPITQISVRVRKMGAMISLMSVPEDARKFSFAPKTGSRRARHSMCGPM